MIRVTYPPLLSCLVATAWLGLALGALAQISADLDLHLASRSAELARLRIQASNIEEQLATLRERERLFEIIDGYRSGLSRREALQLAAVIQHEATTRQLDPYLLVAVIHRESTFRRKARSHRGALGLMQILPLTARQVAAREGVPWEGETTLFDPVANVRIGTSYLHRLIEKFGREDLALEAYNKGPARVARQLRQGRRVRGRYSRWIMDHRDRLESPATARDQGVAL